MLSGTLDYLELDVFSEAARGALREVDEVFALHACGPLHRRLIECAAESELDQLWIAPCCYALDPEPSAFARWALPTPRSKQILTLATQQRTRVRASRERRRLRGFALRLAFEALAQSLELAPRGHACRPPALPRRANQLPFSTFAREAAHALWGEADPRCVRIRDALRGREAEVNWTRCGWRRLIQGAPEEQLRHLFSDTLETLLVSERALALTDQGYAVTLSRFCPPAVSPRGYLIEARRGGLSVGR